MQLNADCANAYLKETNSEASTEKIFQSANDLQDSGVGIQSRTERRDELGMARNEMRMSTRSKASRSVARGQAELVKMPVGEYTLYALQPGGCAGRLQSVCEN